MKRSVAYASAAVLAAGLGVMSAPVGAADPAPPATAAQVFVAPDGSGPACSRAHPCSVETAQQRERDILLTDEGATKDVTVTLADGTYRLAAPLQFGPNDSGRNGHTVTWTAAPGAHPVLSGASRVTGWTQTDSSRNVWSAPVPPGLDTRQIYIDGVEAPIAQTTPAEQGVKFAADTGGYTTTPAWGATLQDEIGSAAMSRVEFVYTGGNGPWTQSRCRVGSVDGAGITMQQPCWTNITSRPVFNQASGGLPSMKAGTAPTRIENAYPFLHPGQWFLDQDKHVLDYVPTAGQDVSTLDIEVPHLTTIVTGTGTLDDPVHNITFSGLEFTDATWTDPSGAAGFADVQDNLRLTGDDPSHPQATCSFGVPPGTCPFGSLTREPGNVSWTAAHDITFEGNTFTRLGAAGLVFEYGSEHNHIEGNLFTDIAGGGVILGNTTDPHPSDVGADEREITAYNTIDNNLIQRIGADYPSAAAVTLFFTRHTQVVHNDIRDVPYTGITAGVIQGHVDNVNHPDNTTNINSDNTISHNLIHGFMQTLSDGGAIYVEGHQGQTITAADGSVDRAASIAHGLHAEGNVAWDEGNSNFTWYDDAGSEWIHWDGNVQWGGAISQGGCQSTGHFDVTGMYSAQAIGQYHCSPAGGIDVTYTDNTQIPARPTAADLPAGTLVDAGLQAPFQHLATDLGPEVTYAQNNGSTIFVAGDGFTPDTAVSFSGVPASTVTVSSPGFLVATAPDGVKTSAFTVTTAAGSATGTVPPMNVLQGKAASQSSDYSASYPAKNAVDGSTSNFADTKNTAQPWWQADAGASYQIDQLKIWNRTDCCQTRLADYYVFVSDTPFTSTSLADTLAQPGVWSSHQTAQADRPTTIGVGRTGRYIRVQLAGTNELALAEVQALTAN